MFRCLISCSGLFRGFCKQKKNSWNEKCRKDLKSNMTVRPPSVDATYCNPVFSEEKKETLKNPFLKLNEHVILVHTDKGVMPFLSTNPFNYDCFGEYPDSIMNLLRDPILKVIECPKDYETQTEEWVEKHRQFHLKTIRSFGV